VAKPFEEYKNCYYAKPTDKYGWQVNAPGGRVIDLYLGPHEAQEMAERLNIYLMAHPPAKDEEHK
jgi:hypothetical protein